MSGSFSFQQMHFSFYPILTSEISLHRWYWMFRVAELRKHHIIGAKIRVFCVRHERCPVAIVGGDGVDAESGGSATVELETAYFVSHPLPLLNGSKSNPRSSPTDTNEEEPHSETSFEQSILMGLPHVLVHRMDSLSPMMPPRPVWYDAGGVPHSPSSPVVPLTTVSEARTENTSEESASENNASSTLLDAETGEGPSALQPPSSGSGTDQPTQEEITHFLQDRQAEIIVFLEGTCEVTGMTLQARHSYTMEDIAFHQTFAPCVFPAESNVSGSGKKWWNPFSKSKAKVDQDSKGGPAYTARGNAALKVDFSQFHDLLACNGDSMSCPYIPASSLRKR